MKKGSKNWGISDKRGRKTSASGDLTDLDKLQAMADRSIRKNLEDPLSKEAQQAGVIGNQEQHGSED